MARGWESKSVESQQAEAAEDQPQLKTRLTPEQAAKQRQREGLILSRNRVRQQMQSAQRPEHRDMLAKALAALDDRIAQLN